MRYTCSETTRTASEPERVADMSSVPGLLPRQLLLRLVGLERRHTANWFLRGIPYLFYNQGGGENGCPLLIIVMWRTGVEIIIFRYEISYSLNYVSYQCGSCVAVSVRINYGYKVDFLITVDCHYYIKSLLTSSYVGN